MDGSSARLLIGVVLATIGSVGFSVVRIIPLLLRYKLFFNWKTWEEGLSFSNGKYGFFIISLWDYLRFYAPKIPPLACSRLRAG